MPERNLPAALPTLSPRARCFPLTDAIKPDLALSIPLSGETALERDARFAVFKGETPTLELFDQIGRSTQSVRATIRGSSKSRLDGVRRATFQVEGRRASATATRV